MNISDINVDNRVDELILSQYKGSENLIKFIKAFLDPLQETANSMDDSMKSRQIDWAFGESLDKIARTFGEERIIRGAGALGYFGFEEEPSAEPLGAGVFYSYGEPKTGDLVLTDVALRNLIRARILKNTSGGKIEDVIKFIELVLGRSVDVMITEQPARVEIHIDEALNPQDKLLLSVRLYSIVPVGVKIDLSDYNGQIEMGDPGGY